ncbi:MAG: hypothetical protein HC906_14445, partial [Bacteroidales bacterium]|nr:hypothetical protein [Bacteroidales bacterium]
GKRINLYFNDYSDFKPSTLYSSVELDIDLMPSDVNLYDLAFFAPVFFGSNQDFSLSGKVEGKLNRLSGKDIDIHFGNSSVLSGDIDLDGLPKFTETFIFAQFKNIETNFTDLQELDLPGKKFEFPSVLNKMGQISYKGKYTGFINDFVAYGTFSSVLGIIKTDLSIKPDKKKFFEFWWKPDDRKL